MAERDRKIDRGRGEVGEGNSLLLSSPLESEEQQEPQH